MLNLLGKNKHEIQATVKYISSRTHESQLHVQAESNGLVLRPKATRPFCPSVNCHRNAISSILTEFQSVWNDMESNGCVGLGKVMCQNMAFRK